jgi:hypothetical protein
VLLRIRQVQRLCFRCDEADKALAGAEHRFVNRLAAQAFGRIEFEAAVDAQHVDRADFRHHVGGDHHHDLVEPFLRADPLRHDLAEPSKQNARTAQRATHGLPSCRGAAPPQ